MTFFKTSGLRFSLMFSLALCFCALAWTGCGGDSDDEEKLQDVPAIASDIVKHRAEKDKYFKYDTASPVPKAMRKSFSGLSYFAYDENYAVIASFEAATKADTVRIPASQGEVRTMIRAGVFSFSLGNDDKVYQLSGFRPADGSSKSILIPFKDKNTGSICYGAGRYVEVEDVGDECTIDFNLAYNPFCAYNDAFSCLLVPPQNILTVAINAGEKTYHPHVKGAKDDHAEKGPKAE